MMRTGISAAGTLTLALCLTTMPAYAVDQILTTDGLGRVKIGMTQREAEKALGTRLKPEAPEDSKPGKVCWYAIRADRIDSMVSYVIVGGKISSIEVSDHALGGTDWKVPSIVTDKGIHIGDTDAKVKEAYGPDLTVRVDSQADNEGEGSVITALTADKSRGFVFVTGSRKVLNFRAGLPDTIDLMEGCLE
jgi:hypothetical protein